MAAAYDAFLHAKSQLEGDYGFAPVRMPSWLFDFQGALVEWALRKGRAAVFADCGLGKTPIELVWADNVVRKTGGRVLLLSPPAVGHHWIWRQYADCMWDDIRIGHVLPFREARDSEDEKHVHPLQLDVIDRCVQLFSNPGETVWTPFMGVGSEVYSPVLLGRRGAGAELKASYFKQACRNVQAAAAGVRIGAETADLLLDEAEIE